MSLTTAEGLGASQNDAVEINAGGRKVIAPVLIVPGHADGAVTVHVGFGRREGGRVGPGVGFNSYLLRTSDAVYTTTGTLKKTGDIYDICVTKVDSIEHRGAFAQQDLNAKEFDTQGLYSLPGHESDGAGAHPLYDIRRGEEEPRVREGRGSRSSCGQGGLRAGGRGANA